MKAGIIAPTNKLRKYCILSSLQYCYATLILSSPTYYTFYRERLKQGDIVILDSTPKLPRKYDTTDILLDAAYKLHPSAIVLPSSDFALERTIIWSEHFQSKLKLTTKTIGVLQGYDTKTLKKCYKELTCDLIGLPSNLEKVKPRNKLVTQLQLSKPILFIEIYSDPLFEVPVDGNILGIVTSFPIRLAYDCRKLNEYLPEPPTLDFETEKEPLPELTEKNISKFIKAVEVQ